MIQIIKKPDQKEFTTIIGKDVHKIIEKNLSEDSFSLSIRINIYIERNLICVL